MGFVKEVKSAINEVLRCQSIIAEFPLINLLKKKIPLFSQNYDENPVCNGTTKFVFHIKKFP